MNKIRKKNGRRVFGAVEDQRGKGASEKEVDEERADGGGRKHG